MFNKWIVEISGNWLLVVGCHKVKYTLPLLCMRISILSFNCGELLKSKLSTFRHSSLILWETNFNNNWHCSSSLFIMHYYHRAIHCGQSIKLSWEWDPSLQLWIDKSESRIIHRPDQSSMWCPIVMCSLGTWCEFVMTLILSPKDERTRIKTNHKKIYALSVLFINPGLMMMKSTVMLLLLL